MRYAMRGLGLALLLAGLASAARAQTRLDVGGFGGLTLPTQGAADLYKAGYNLGGTVRLKNGDRPVGFQLDVAYHTMASEDFRFDGGLDILSATLGVVFPVEIETTNLVPYLLAGAGVYRLDAKFPRTSEPYGTKTRAGLILGGGLEWRSRSARLVPSIDLRMNGIFGGDPRETAYLQVNGGLKYVFGGKRPR